MKKCIYVLMIALFFGACAKTSSNFVNVSMPRFKPQTPIEVKAVSSGVKISLEPINIEQNNDYSDYFENSTLKIRIDKEIELLKQNLEEQIKIIAQLKGYELDNANAKYKLQSLVQIYISEKNAQKSSQWLNGDFVNSNLGLAFKAQMNFVEINDPQNITRMTSNAELSPNIDLTYPIKNDEGISLFKTTFSTVATQLNKGLERPAFDIDKTFLSFYKGILDTLYNNLPQASHTNAQDKASMGNQEFNEFINDDSFNENSKENSQNSDGVEFFE